MAKATKTVKIVAKSKIATQTAKQDLAKATTKKQVKVLKSLHDSFTMDMSFLDLY